MVVPIFGGFGSGGIVGSPPPSGYVPQLVTTEGDLGHASYTSDQNVAADSFYEWFYLVADFANDNTTEQLFKINGRGQIRRVTTTLDIDIVGVGNQDIFRGSIINLPKDVLTTIYFGYNGVTGTKEAFVNGLDVTDDMVVSLDASTGGPKVEYTRTGSNAILGSLNLNRLGDLHIGTGVPPGIGAFYQNGQQIDPSGVAADFKFQGDASVFNAGPGSPWVVGGSFEDVA